MFIRVLYATLVLGISYANAQMSSSLERTSPMPCQQNGKPAILSSPLPMARVGIEYLVQLGFPVPNDWYYPFTFNYSGLPKWLQPSLPGAPGLLRGTPQPEDATAQPISFSLTVVDAQGNSAAPLTFSISVCQGTPIYQVIAVAAKSLGEADQNGAQPSNAVPAPTPASTPATPPKPAAALVSVTTGTDSGTPNARQDGSATHGSAAPSSSSSAATALEGTKTADPMNPNATNKRGQKALPRFSLHEPIWTGMESILGTAEPGSIVELIRQPIQEKDPTRSTAVADLTTGAFRIDLPGPPLKAGEDLEFRQTVAGETSPSIYRQVQPSYRSGEELRAILGYQQAGASAAQSTQNWFLDFYISRPLSFVRQHDDTTLAKWRWWGNLQVASYPQQGDIPVATFASSFLTQFGQLKVNQLVQSAEFLSGLQYNLFSSKTLFLGKSENTRQQYTLGLIAAGGATGPMNPTSSVSVFDVPTPASPQFPVFRSAFPGVTSKFIGFASPDRDTFLKQYLVGLRLTTTYLGRNSRAPMIATPAMVSASIGQNEVVTGGRLSGAVLRTDAFYPLPFNNRSQDRRGALSAIYLFGTSQMRLGGPRTHTPLILAPETSVSGADPNVTIVSVPGNRDVYRVGFGIDLVNAITSLTRPAQKNAASGADQ